MTSNINSENFPSPESGDGFLSGDSEMAALIRSHDWSNTPLGPLEHWPQSLRTIVNLCLASNFSICIIWGPEHTQIYNDGYRIVCGARHPAAMGMNYRKCWASAWPAIGQPFDKALNGITSFLENQRMYLFRNGYLEETFFTFSLSPIQGEAGGIGGVFHPVVETTTTMVGERRTRAVFDLTACLSDAEETAEVFRRTIAALATFTFDLPFLLLYQLDSEERIYRLAGCTGIEKDTCLTPAVLALEGSAIWPIEQLLHQASPVQVSGLRARIGSTPCGPYEEAPDVAFALSIREPGSDLPVALVIAGASSRLPLTDAYRRFYDLLAAAFRAALGRAKAAQEERERLHMLASIDRAKTVFFSNVSHEFRTPLTLMLAPLEEALEAENLPPQQRERLEFASRNAQRLLKLVNSLLDFSRIEAGRNDASFMPTDLSALTIDLASNFRSACERAGLTLTVECAPLREPVYVDSDMWEKIVLNLLSNAFKFTLHGGIKVSLRELGDGIELAVADTGVGIPTAELPKIFERFHRVEGQHGRSMEGTGIGLSLVQELIHLHGGTIVANSTVGLGTIFTLGMPFGIAHLPAAQVHTESNAERYSSHAQVYVKEALGWLLANDHRLAQRALVKRAPTPDMPRIVLADDNADMRDYIERILEQGGYAVEAVSNGAEALIAVNNGALPDLVLTDVMMPDMDGFAFLNALRANQATKGIVVILLSAHAGEEARVEGLAAGADDYLVKPFSARELRARIDGAIALARQRREAAARERALLIEIETERARAALRESEAHVASLFEQTTAGIAETDFAGVLVRVNDRYCQIVKRNRNQIIGVNIRTLVHPDDWKQNKGLLDRLIHTGEPLDIENRYLRPDGTAVWVSETVNMIRADAFSKPDKILAIVIDISERKKAEEKLRDTARRLEFTLKAAQIGDWDFDVLSGTATRSLRHDQCYGYTEPVAHWDFEKMIGHVHADDREQVTQQFNTALSELKDLHYDCRVIWPDQSIHWIRVHGSFYHIDVKPTRMIGTIVDITEFKEAENKIQNLAFFDSLTQLPNRRLLLDRLQQALVVSGRHHIQGALLFIDLDNFKSLNDTLGHQIGDQLLIKVAACLKACVREGDSVARLGGDEFVVILEDLHGNSEECAIEVEHISEKILASLNRIERLGGFDHHTTASIGITLFNNDGLTVDELMKHADLAMYQAKAAGRNTLRFFDPEMQLIVAARVKMESELREAISKNEFILYFQPQVDENGKLMGFEALARWQNPVRGIVFPGEFMPVIEQTALIFPFGLWVLKSACMQLSAWATNPRAAHLSLAVNVSAREFKQSNFVDQVLDAVRSSGAKPSNLKLELTETVLLDDVEEAIIKMQALKKNGVRFSLDDFGIGYASLSYLKRLPFAQLKIDQSFIQNLLTDPNDTAIVKMVIELARSMHIEVIAEGVETKEQHDFLIRHGCGAYQGYLFSLPLSQDALDGLLCDTDVPGHQRHDGTVLDINPGWNRRSKTSSVTVDRRHA